MDGIDWIGVAQDKERWRAFVGGLKVNMNDGKSIIMNESKYLSDRVIKYVL